MKKTLPAILLTGLLCTTALPAFANQKDDRIQALESQLKFLATEVQTLKNERAAEKAEIAAIKSFTRKTAKAIARIEPAAGTTTTGDKVKISMTPSPKIQYGDFSWQPFGRIHLDTAFFNDDKADHPDGTEFRRARLGMKGTLTKDLSYKVEIDFANEGVNFKDVYFKYAGFKNTDIRLGSFKPSFAMEERTSTNYITFIESAAPTAAFATGEIIGLETLFYGDNWTLTAGAFNDDAGTQSSDDEAFYLASRATFSPVHSETRALHLGATVGYRKPDQATNSFDFDTKAENALQSVDSVSANFTNADHADLYGLETAAVFGPVSLQSEYYRVDVDRTGANNDVSFDGGYFMASLFLTGESRPYNVKKGSFGRVTPNTPFNLHENGWGAFEITARHSRLDLTDDTVTGGEMRNNTVGINWYLNKHARLMTNYIMSDTDANAVTANDAPRVLLFRAQGDF